MDPLFSIIIPVYNSEEYLKECLNSITCQSFKSYEIIIIDDGSTDNSYEILAEYQRNFDCIRLLKQTNKGQGSARNKGIDIALGKYIWFVDSDDSIASNALEILSKKLTDDPVDTLIFSYEFVEDFEEDKEAKKITKKSGFQDGFECKEYTQPEILYSFLEGKIQPLCCNKIYSKTLFEDGNGKFKKGIFFEDFVHNALMISTSQTVGLLPEDLYFYNERKSSTMTSKCSQKHVNSIFIAIKTIKEILVTQGVFGDMESAYIKLFWFHLTFVYHIFILESDLELNTLFIEKLDELTEDLPVDYYLPIKYEEIEEEVFPFATLLGLLNQRLEEEGMEEKVFMSFNLPEEMMG